MSIKEGRATIGVQRPSSDPHIESFDDHDLSELTQEALAVVERARAKWEDEPKYPAHERPAPPARRQPRRSQGSARDARPIRKRGRTPRCGVLPLAAHVYSLFLLPGTLDYDPSAQLPDSSWCQPEPNTSPS